MQQSEILQKLDEFIQAEHLDLAQEKYLENDPRLVEAALEVAQSSKSILGGLYYDFRKPNQGKIRQLKNFVIGKISNIVRNNMEKSLMSQQKFNEQILFLLKVSLAENKKLKEQIAQLTNH